MRFELHPKLYVGLQFWPNPTTFKWYALLLAFNTAALTYATNQMLVRKTV